jgi:hypothetical protein
VADKRGSYKAGIIAIIIALIFLYIIVLFVFGELLWILDILIVAILLIVFYHRIKSKYLLIILLACLLVILPKQMGVAGYLDTDPSVNQCQCFGITDIWDNIDLSYPVFCYGIPYCYETASMNAQKRATIEALDSANSIVTLRNSGTAKMLTTEIIVYANNIKQNGTWVNDITSISTGSTGRFDWSRDACAPRTQIRVTSPGGTDMATC